MAGSCRIFFLLLVAVACASCASKTETSYAHTPVAAEQQSLGVASEGKALFNTCIACHGFSGEGKIHLSAPALVNLDGWYLYRQLMNFKNGVRGNHEADTLGSQMAAIARALKDSTEVHNVVAYIEALPEVSLENTIEGDIKKGERTYQSICGSCHGPNGKGNKAMNSPRLNGLDDWYLKAQVIKFRNSIRGAHPIDKHGAQMVSMAALLKDEQAINDVIAFIRSTPRVTP